MSRSGLREAGAGSSNLLTPTNLIDQISVHGQRVLFRIALSLQRNKLVDSRSAASASWGNSVRLAIAPPDPSSLVRRGRNRALQFVALFQTLDRCDDVFAGFVLDTIAALEMRHSTS